MKYWHKNYHTLCFDKEIQEFVVNEYLNNNKSFYEIARENDWSRTIVRKIFLLSGNKVKEHTKRKPTYTCNENFFESIDNEEKAYWLGMMYTDGFIVNNTNKNNWDYSYRVGIILTERDKEHLEKFKQALNFTGEIKTYNPTIKENSWNTKRFSRLLVTSNKLANDLINCGCKLNKTLVLTYPTFLPLELERHFIRGLLDGDGSLMIKQNKNFAINFNGTKEVCEGILKFFGKENTKLSQSHPERNNNNYYFSIGGNKQILRLLEDIYKDATIYLDRKYEKYLEMLERSRTKE